MQTPRVGRQSVRVGWGTSVNAWGGVRGGGVVISAAGEPPLILT